MVASDPPPPPPPSRRLLLLPSSTRGTGGFRSFLSSSSRIDALARVFCRRQTFRRRLVSRRCTREDRRIHPRWVETSARRARRRPREWGRDHPRSDRPSPPSFILPNLSSLRVKSRERERVTRRKSGFPIHTFDVLYIMSFFPLVILVPSPFSSASCTPLLFFWSLSSMPLLSRYKESRALATKIYSLKEKARQRERERETHTHSRIFRVSKRAK